MGTVNFSIDSNFLNDTLRQFWVELECEKIENVRQSIPGLSETLIRGILVGTNKFVNDPSTGDMLYTSDEATELFGIELSVANIRKRFDEAFYDCYDRIYGYEKCLNQLDQEDDDFEYFSELIETYHEKLAKTKKEFKFFLILCAELPELENSNFVKIGESSIKKRVLNDQKVQIMKENYEMAQANYSKELNFSRQNALNVLFSNISTIALGQLCALDNTNGLKYLPEHKMAQEECEEIRPYIYPENPIKTCWNSGWVSPKGWFFGCSDLSHIEFSKELLKLGDDGLGCHIDTSGYNSDMNAEAVFENNGWLKLSSGRWMWMDEDEDGNPRNLTKEQYSVIFELSKYRGDIKVFLSPTYSTDEWCSLDLLESKMNSAKSFDE